MGREKALGPLKRTVFWIFLLFLFSLVIKNFFFEVFTVSQRSMEPTLEEGDLVLVSIIYYKFFQPHEGDVVVLKSPDGKLVVKRIEKIKGNKIFVLGDNLIESLDSRTWGYLDKRCIIGKVLLKLYPELDRIN